jgi:lipooligosaccharide transport system ATP-binding protein
VGRYSAKEVVELRFAPDVDTAATGRELRCLADRVEILPGRLLLYAADGDALLAAIHLRGIAPLSSLVRRSTLEDVFLRLTGRTLKD